MKALKDCNWRVVVREDWSKGFFFLAISKELNGLDCKEIAGKSYKSRKAALKNWVEFAKVNKIKNYKSK